MRADFIDESKVDHDALTPALTELKVVWLYASASAVARAVYALAVEVVKVAYAEPSVCSRVVTAEPTHKILLVLFVVVLVEVSGCVAVVEPVCAKAGTANTSASTVKAIPIFFVFIKLLLIKSKLVKVYSYYRVLLNAVYTRSMSHEPKTLQELRSTRKPILNTNQIVREKLTPVERLAMWITKRVGTMGFFFIILGWTLLWLGWNTLGPDMGRFDPFPGFVMWLFISNMIQIFLMPLIMVGQNLQSRHSEARVEADFEVNTRAEQEIEAILTHLENQNELILKILHKIEG